MENTRFEAARDRNRPLVVLSISRSVDDVRFSDAHHLRVRRRLFEYFGDSIVLREVLINATGRLARRSGLAVAEAMLPTGDIDVVVAEDCTRISRNASRVVQFVQAAVSRGIAVHFLDG